MIINAKDHVKRCPACGMAVGFEHDSFCHNCGEFFTAIANRWLDPINKWIDQGLGSLDVIEGANEDD
jgi:hypothetical protein